jgi:type II secretory pathway pseudopilin PulG
MGFIVVLAVFGGLIYLLVWSIKRAKRKGAEQKELVGKLTEQQKVIEESLITTGYPPQNMPTVPFNFWQWLLLGILTTPIGLFILVGVAKSSTTKQQNRVKEERTKRGITLSPEAYNASEAYFDKQRAEANKIILPGILAWVVLIIIIVLISN